MTEDKNTIDERVVEDRIRNLVTNLSLDKKQQLLELLVEWQQHEQRLDQRIPCLISVDLSSKTRAYREFAQDLSKGGVFIETREPLKVGEKIAMAFSLQDTQSHFKFAGTIVRVEKHGVAIQFDSKLSKYQEEIIRQYLNKK